MIENIGIGINVSESSKFKIFFVDQQYISDHLQTVFKQNMAKVRIVYTSIQITYFYTKCKI